MNVLLRTASPFLAARYELELDHAFRAEAQRDDAVEILHRGRHEDADAFPECGLDFGPVDELTDVRRADLFLSLGHHHQVHRHFSPGAANGMQRRQKRRFWPFLVDRAATDDHLAEAWPVDEPRLERRRRPLGWIELLHVIHEVEPDSLCRAGIQRRKDTGLAV